MRRVQKRRYPCTQTASAVPKYFPCLLQFCTGYRICHASRAWKRKTFIFTQLKISRYNPHFFAIFRLILINWPPTYLLSSDLYIYHSDRKMSMPPDLNTRIKTEPGAAQLAILPSISLSLSLSHTHTHTHTQYPPPHTHTASLPLTTVTHTHSFSPTDHCHTHTQLLSHWPLSHIHTDNYSTKNISWIFCLFLCNSYGHKSVHKNKFWNNWQMQSTNAVMNVQSFIQK